MQYKVFSIPLSDAADRCEELNKFLRSHRILQTERQFSASDGGYWTILVEYVDGQPADAAAASRRERKDVTIDMSEPVRQRFEQLRQIRKRVANEQQVAAFVVFSDKELAVLARLPYIDAESTHELKGVAPAKLEMYGKHFYGANPYGETSGQPNAADNDTGEPA